MKPSNSSFLKSLIQSFGFAFDGIRAMLTERNFRVHLIATLITIATGLYLQIDFIEWSIIMICIALVLSAEGFNTAIELICDRITPDNDFLVGKIKDISAAAVLILALASVIVAAFIFLPNAERL